MIVRPAVPGVIVTTDPDLLTVATDVNDELAPYVSVSLSGSWKAAATSTATAMDPTVSCRSAIIPTDTGGWFAPPAITDTGALRAASPPPTTAATQ